MPLRPQSNKSSVPIVASDREVNLDGVVEPGPRFVERVRTQPVLPCGERKALEAKVEPVAAAAQRLDTAANQPGYSLQAG